MRTHVVLSDDLLKEIDKVAGKRKRSEYIEEAVRTKLRLERQRRAIEMMRNEGPDAPVWYMPGLEDYDDVSDFIHDQRRKGDEHRMKKLGFGPGDDAISARQ